MIKLKNLIYESIEGSVFISVDIQPEYAGAFGFSIYEFTSFLNENFEKFDKLIFLYNGADTVDGVNLYDYQAWLIENGLNPDIVEQSKFYDKGYAFFRFCIDNYIDETAIVNFVTFLYKNQINDSREMTREMWAKYLKLHRRQDKLEVYQLLKHSDDFINIPDLMDFLRIFRTKTVITGGGINECLKEVEIALKALGTQYSIYQKFTY